MFSVADRVGLREALIERARSDSAVTGCALVGSAADGREDRWSDIDLALELSPNATPDAVADEWADVLYKRHGAVHHLDVRAGALYRVFLLADSLQVDLSFWPNEELRATTPSFRLVFGEPGEPSFPPPPSVGTLAGWGWLYALHARSALARDRCWQALYMVDHLLEQVVSLSCVRHGLLPHEGRGVDRLPSTVRDALGRARATSVDPEEILRAFGAATALLLDEVALADPQLAGRISPTVDLIATSTGS